MKSCKSLVIICCCVFALLAYSGSASASTLSCDGWVSGWMDFGKVNPLSGTTDTSVNVTVGCSVPTPGTSVFVCLSAGAEPSTGGYDPRYLTQSSDKLAFNLYKDSAKTNILGSVDSGGAYSALGTVQTISSWSGQFTMPIYGRISSTGQTGVPSGTYKAMWPFKVSYVAYQQGMPTSCTGMQAAPHTSFTLSMGATVESRCQISSASTMNFGSVFGLLNHNVDSTSTITVMCNGVDYWVGLNNGQHASGTTRRMQGPNGNDHVQYELYTNPQRTQRWGNSVNYDAEAGTGNGQPQALTVYGRVPPQTLVGQGVFSDTVVITVTY